MNTLKNFTPKIFTCLAVAVMACSVMAPSNTFAQVKNAAKKVPPPPPPLPVIDKLPQFPGGQAAFYTYLKNNIKYPDSAKRKNVSGRVFLSFFVEADGNLNELAVVKGIGAGCDQEALRVMRNSPKWEPSIKNGKPVRAKMTVPIAFTLAGKKTPALTPPIAKRTINGKEVYTLPQQSAEFPGGIQKFYTYLEKNMKYPELARKNNVQGKVFVTFVIKDDGSITDAKILRGIGSGCDEEAIRVLLKGPKWNPGKQNGKAINQQYTVPFSFNLAKG